MELSQKLKTNPTRNRLPVSLWASSLALIFVTGAITSSCVTVNVNLPEAAVQRAADDYVREIYRSKDKTKTPVPAAEQTPKKTSSISELLIPSANAAESGLQTKSAKTSAIQGRMTNRVDEVLAQKRTGVLGESNDGMLVLKAPDKAGALLLKKVQKTVEDENADRRDLYTEVVRVNGLDATRKTSIQQSFARSFQAESPAGTWIQDPTGHWSQKP